ncbi:hypothetical protein BDW22DRAFT_1180431 [Trametopsis cervina]|nr:hypothetical protein BDW22DRAFT_1180431 [Trametopsis cervina]
MSFRTLSVRIRFLKRRCGKTKNLVAVGGGAGVLGCFRRQRPTWVAMTLDAERAMFRGLHLPTNASLFSSFRLLLRLHLSITLTTLASSYSHFLHHFLNHTS